MDRTVRVMIDQERCTGCGRCISVCPERTLSIVEGRAAVTGHRSMGCDLCAAACPEGAIAVETVDSAAARFATLAVNDAWIPFGTYDTEDLVQLMASRRSCRNYTSEAVPRTVLDDLVKVGITAPSGTNSQKWTFTVLPTRQSVLSVGREVAAFFRRLNRIAANPLVRGGLKLIGKKELDTYWRNYAASVGKALDEWDGGGKERLFHGATAAIIVGSGPGASCPAEDALLATQNILLAAHAMGLGSCLIGFVVAAMKKDGRVKRVCGIPDDEEVYAVIALGYPKERYVRRAGRRMPIVRYHDI